MSEWARESVLRMARRHRYPAGLEPHRYRRGVDPGPAQGALQPRRPRLRDPGYGARSWRPRSRRCSADRSKHHYFAVGLGTDTGGFSSLPGPRPDAAQSPLTYPVPRLSRQGDLPREQSGTRTFDLNTDGVAHYGLIADLLADMQQHGGRPALAIPLPLRRGLPADLAARLRALGARSAAPRRFVSHSRTAPATASVSAFSPWSPGILTTSRFAPGGGMPKRSLSPWTTRTGRSTASSSGRRLCGGLFGPREAGSAERRGRGRLPHRSPRRCGRRRARRASGHPRSPAGQPAPCPAGARGPQSRPRRAASPEPGSGGPATRYGCSTRATVKPASTAASLAATRSTASTPPPAPWPRTSAPFGRRAGCRCARAGPEGVSICAGRIGATTYCPNRDGRPCARMAGRRWVLRLGPARANVRDGQAEDLPRRVRRSGGPSAAAGAWLPDQQRRLVRRRRRAQPRPPGLRAGLPRLRVLRQAARAGATPCDRDGELLDHYLG